MGRSFEVPFTSEGLAVSIPRDTILRFSSDDLAHALFVTGRAPGDQGRYGDASVWEWLHRSSLVPAYVRLAAQGDGLMRSELAESLDRSEKVALSYALGQAMTAVFCRQVLGVRFLMHVDRYASRWRLNFATGRRRPDLFGRIAAARWVVAESKGRSNGMEAALSHTLKQQKGMIRSIAGHAPAVALGCVASFPTVSWRGERRMRIDVVDPESDERSVSLDEVTDEQFLRTYYEPFLRAIEVGQPSSDEADYVASELPESGIRVGLRRAIYEAINAGESPQLSQLADGDEVSDDAGMGDGTLVETQWDSALNLRDYEGGTSGGISR